MFLIGIEIAICVILGIGLIVTLILCSRIDRGKLSNDEQKKIEFLPTSVNEELLVQNALLAYYEQQRNELIERQKVALDDSTLDMTILKNNDSGYTSIPSPSHTPHSLYECTGFASMDNLEVSNPLFATDVFCDNGQVLMTPPSPTK